MSASKSSSRIPFGYIVTLVVLVAVIGSSAAIIVRAQSLVELYAFLTTLVLGTVGAILRTRRKQ